jgi:hypothetical protein
VKVAASAAGPSSPAPASGAPPLEAAGLPLVRPVAAALPAYTVLPDSYGVVAGNPALPPLRVRLRSTRRSGSRRRVLGGGGGRVCRQVCRHSSQNTVTFMLKRILDLFWSEASFKMLSCSKSVGVKDAEKTEKALNRREKKLLKLAL